MAMTARPQFRALIPVAVLRFRAAPEPHRTTSPWSSAESTFDPCERLPECECFGNDRSAQQVDQMVDIPVLECWKHPEFFPQRAERREFRVATSNDWGGHTEGWRNCLQLHRRRPRISDVHDDEGAHAGEQNDGFNQIRVLRPGKIEHDWDVVEAFQLLPQSGQY